MEESPHKCPVCSRSFNQRSNLKTHLLTHTDHKPYECSSCGKVFRRNCDLRRHALTHAVGGDMAGSEILDVGEEDDKILSGDEDDTVLEVDSPVHSPNQPQLQKDDEIDTVDGETLMDSGNGGNGDTIVDYSSDQRPQQQQHNSHQLLNSVDHERQQRGITHCHHEGANETYTMRPYSGAKGELVMKDNGSGNNDAYLIPMLHVRRDLHDHSHRVPNFLESLSSRKRPMGIDGEPIVQQHPMDLNMKRASGYSTQTPVTHTQTATTTTSTVPSGSNSMSPKPSTSTNLSERQSPQPPPPPPRRKGFSIEDIMRR